MHCWWVIQVLCRASYGSQFDMLQFWGLMAESISSSLSHRIRGLLFPYRFNCVVNSFFLYVCGKGKREGIELERRVERKVRHWWELSSSTERIRARNGRITCWVMIGTKLLMSNGILFMNIFKAVPHITSSKELKPAFKIVSKDLKCRSLWISFTGHIPLYTSICTPENSSPCQKMMLPMIFPPVCRPTCQRAGHLFTQVAC